MSALVDKASPHKSHAREAIEQPELAERIGDIKLRLSSDGGAGRTPAGDQASRNRSRLHLGAARRVARCNDDKEPRNFGLQKHR